eukprot:Rhum_TRINITY_DN14848_c12_g1::Rhum_TRINITY_DN14848_c12_g1_i1::g.122735::m.122735
MRLGVGRGGEGREGGWRDGEFECGVFENTSRRYVIASQRSKKVRAAALSPVCHVCTAWGRTCGGGRGTCPREPLWMCFFRAAERVPIESPRLDFETQNDSLRRMPWEPFGEEGPPTVGTGSMWIEGRESGEEGAVDAVPTLGAVPASECRIELFFRDDRRDERPGDIVEPPEYKSSAAALCRLTRELCCFRTKRFRGVVAWLSASLTAPDWEERLERSVSVSRVGWEASEPGSSKGSRALRHSCSTMGDVHTIHDPMRCLAFSDAGSDRACRLPYISCSAAASNSTQPSPREILLVTLFFASRTFFKMPPGSLQI